MAYVRLPTTATPIEAEAQATAGAHQAGGTTLQKKHQVICVRSDSGDELRKWRFLGETQNLFSGAMYVMSIADHDWSMLCTNRSAMFMCREYAETCCCAQLSGICQSFVPETSSTWLSACASDCCLEICMLLAAQ